MDSCKSIFFCPIKPSKPIKTDYRTAIEILENSKFIQLCPTKNDIWAVNSLRQLLVCKDFKSKLSNGLTFTCANEVFNVMRATMGDKHQIIIKIVKELDPCMLRDIWVKKENEFPEEDFDIPVPSYLSYDALDS